MAYAFNPYPSPTSGSGTTFGRVPGMTPLPQPAADLGYQIPGLPGLNAQASRTISDKLGGNISPATQKALQDAAARYGMQVGQPGMSPLAYNNLFGNIAGFAENQAEQALQDYSRFVPTVSATQTVRPELQASIAEQNAVLGAAPDPAAAQSHAESLFANYLAATRGGGRQPYQPPSITPYQISSGFGTPDQVYRSSGTGMWYDGGTRYGNSPETAAAAAPISMQGPDILSMSDDEFMDYVTGMGG